MRHHHLRNANRELFVHANPICTRNGILCSNLLSLFKNKKVNSRGERGKKVSWAKIRFLKQTMAHLDFHQTPQNQLVSGGAYK